MHHLLDKPRLDLLVQRIELQVRGGSEDVKRSSEVEGAVGEGERARVDVSEGEMDRSRSERR